MDNKGDNQERRPKGVVGFIFFFMLVGPSVEIGSKVFFFLYCMGMGRVCVSIFYFFCISQIFSLS
jgi:hypothetical protein